MVGRAEAVIDPGAHARPADLAKAGVQKIIRVGMLGKGGGHRADHAQFIGVPGHVREEIADRNTRLTVMLKLPRTGERFAAAVKLRGLHLQPERLTVLLREPGFGIEGIHRGWAAIHVQENDALGLGREMGLLGRKRVNRLALRFLRQKRGQRQSAKTIGAPRQHIPSRHW